MHRKEGWKKLHQYKIHQGVHSFLLIFSSNVSALSTFSAMTSYYF